MSPRVGSGRGRVLRLLLLAAGGAVFLLLVAGAAAYRWVTIPDPNDLAISQISVVYYAGGKKELGQLGDANRIAVPLARVPQHVQDAVIAAEDREFHSGEGVSARGMVRALFTNLRGGGPTQGGSTITQQYVKNYYLTQERTLTRKLKEIVLAVKIDDQLTKQQILEAYLNTIYFGRGAYGIQTAAKAYFGKDVSALSVAEGATLAALIRSPSRYQAQPGALKARFRHVLDAMTETGALRATDAAQQRFPTFVREWRNRYAGQTGYLLTAIEAELERRAIDPRRVRAGGLRIETTLQRKAQQAAVKAVDAEAPTKEADGLRIGLAAVEPGTGRIRAMYGGQDYLANAAHAQENNATAAVPAGSIFKALTLARAMEEDIGLYDRFAGNSPLRLPNSPPVRNQQNIDWGRTVSLLRATEESINTAYVDLATQVGPKDIADAATRAGIPENQMRGNINARLTLGITPVSAVQMAGAYATFAAEGMHATPHLIQRATGPDGEEIELAPIEPERAFDEDVSAKVTYALSRVVRNGTGTRARGLGRAAAAKTGTHEGHNGIQTAWFVGYTPQLATAVTFFKGDGNQSLAGVGGYRIFTGGRYPAALWTAFMRAALSGMPAGNFGRPGGSRDSRAPAPTDQGIDEPTATETATPTVAPTPTRTPSPTPTRTRRPPIACPPLCGSSDPTESPGSSSTPTGD